MKKSSLFFVLLCLFQISKLGFCLAGSVHTANNNGDKRHGFIRVTNFGAVGDGKTDDTQAFLKAWEAVCNGGSNNTTLLVPLGKIFMLKPLKFAGPCKSSSVTFLVRGNLVAPGYTWDMGNSPAWISFDRINGLVVIGGGVKGGGTLDSRGSVWWGSGHAQDRPTAMHFNNCNGLRIYNLQHLNSPRNHISLSGSKNISVSGLKLTAPGDSPNTDGIDISNCIGVDIRDSVISTGDDCIAINSGSSYINITGLFADPVMELGSLGKAGAFATVEEVRVKNCTLTNTTNGVRIKTYQNGLGYARKISFEDIKMVDSQNPIIIEQNYINRGKIEEVGFEYSNYQNRGSKNRFYKTESGNGRGVKVSDVRYSRIYGTSASDDAVTFNCNADLGCDNIVMDHVNIVSAKAGQVVSASCNNVHGSYLNSPVSCIKK